MSAITINLSPETYQRLQEQARRIGQPLEVVSRALLESALQSCDTAPPRTAREVLQAAGHVRPLSTTLRSRIIPGVTLNEVQTILAQTTNPTLSTIIQEQRGAKS